MKLIVGALAVALLAGCASSAIPVSQADPVPRDELYAFQNKPAGESGKVTVVRDSGMVGSGCDIVVYVDGRKAAKIGTGQRASFTCPGQSKYWSGSCWLRAVWRGGHSYDLCQCAKWKRKPLPNQWRYERLLSGSVCRLSVIEFQTTAFGRFLCSEKGMHSTVAHYQPMTTIKLSGSLAAKFGRVHRRVLDSGQAWEAFRALKATLDGFKEEIQRLDRLGMRFAVFRNRRNVGEAEFGLGGTTDIRIVPVIHGSKKAGLIQTIVGAVLIVAGTFLSTTPFGAPLIGAGIGLVAGGVIQMLSPKPQA